MGAVLQTPETWVALSLALFFGILGYFGAHRIVLSHLDRRADGIRSRIEEARRLREEAGAVVEKHERDLRDAQNAHGSSIELAKKDAQLAREAMLKEFRETLDRQLDAAEQRIRQAEISAQREVRNRSIDVAMAAASDVIRQQLGEDGRARLADRGIERLAGHLGRSVSAAPFPGG